MTLLRIEALAVNTTRGAPFRDLDFRIERGEAVGVTCVGPADLSGLLEVLAGLRQPSGGQLIWEGLPALASLSDPAATERERYRSLRWLRRSSAYVADSIGLIHNLSIWDNIALPLRYHVNPPERTVHERATRLVELLRLEDYVAARPAGTSLGVRRRAIVARALILDPVILILDSPLAGLDEESKDLVLGVLSHYLQRAALSAIIAAYDPRTILPAVTRVLVFGGGRLVDEVDTREMSETEFHRRYLELRGRYSIREPR